MSATISDPSVMDTMSLVLATSTNQELLEKCSKCLASLIEFAEDMDNCLPFFRQCATRYVQFHFFTPKALRMMILLTFYLIDEVG